MIAALQVSLDGFATGPDGAVDWVESWADGLGLLPEVDTFVLGGGMYGDYEQFWGAILEAPEAAAAMLGRAPFDCEIAYARLASQTPHVVLSTTLTGVTWPNARIVRDTSALRDLKQAPGLDIYVVGGPGLVSSLVNDGLLDELRLIVHPILLARGSPLFGGVGERRALDFVDATPLASGRVALTYRSG
jgi:dihydrofolate reductase